MAQPGTGHESPGEWRSRHWPRWWGRPCPAADYLPRLGLDRRITVRMLLQHTSGVFNYTGEYYPDGTVGGAAADRAAARAAGHRDAGHLDTFISALLGGKLLPAPLLAEMLKPHPTPDPASEYGLGLFELHADANCSGTMLINHNGHVQGYATLMYSTPDGSKTLTASLTFVEDSTPSQAAAYRKAVQKLTELQFCDPESIPGLMRPKDVRF